MLVSDIIKNRPYLAWYVKDPENLSDQSILEHILNYGNWEDVQTFIKIMGIDKSNKIFNQSLRNKRTNYFPAIKSYFIRYFNRKNADSSFY